MEDSSTRFMKNSNEADNRYDRDYETVEEYEIVPRMARIDILRSSLDLEYIYKVTETGLSEENKDQFDSIANDLETIIPNLKGIPDDFDRYDIDEMIDIFLSSNRTRLPVHLEEAARYYLKRNYGGFGPLDVIVNDQYVEDISCDGVGSPIFVYHKKYGSIKTNIIFADEDFLNSYVIRLALICGKEISINAPIVDGITPQGHRIQLMYGREASAKGSAFTMRLFRETPFTPAELISLGTASPKVMTYLWYMIENLSSAIIAGAPAVGKTSTLNSILMFVPPNTKVFSIEETREINIVHKNWVASSTREGNYSVDRKGTVGSLDLFDLVRMAMRQRPTYIVVGEIRGKEAYVLFQAMSTGHTTYSTMHADSMDLLVNRLESSPLNVPRILLTYLNTVVFSKFVSIENSVVRRITEVNEIAGFDNDTNEIVFNKVFSYDVSSNDHVYLGYSKLFNKIQSARGISEKRFFEEFEIREKLLAEMANKKIFDYMEFARVINAYYGNPANAFEMLSEGSDEA